MILHATLDPKSPHAGGEWSKECIIKVFETVDSGPKRCTRAERLWEEELQSETRSHYWLAKKEMSNLMRVSSTGVPCPEIITMKKNAVVMTFLGKNREAAPKLIYASLSCSELVSAYEQVSFKNWPLY